MAIFIRRHEPPIGIKLIAVMNIVIFVYTFWICLSGYIVFNRLVDMKTFRGSSQGITKPRIPSYSLALARGVRISLRYHHKGSEIREIATTSSHLLLSGFVCSVVGLLIGILLLLAEFIKSVRIAYCIWIVLESVVVFIFLVLGIFCIIEFNKNILVFSSIVFLLPCLFFIGSVIFVVVTLYGKHGWLRKNEDKQDNKERDVNEPGDAVAETNNDKLPSKTASENKSIKSNPPVKVELVE